MDSSIKVNQETSIKYDFITNPSPSKLPSFTPRLRIGVMASGNGSNFESLVNLCQNGDLDADIKALVVNNPNCQARFKSEHYGIPCIVLDHRRFNNRVDMDNAIIDSFSKYNIEGIVMAGWMRIVTNQLIKKYPERLINIHPSLLPSFKGIDAVAQALEYGVNITGCTVHFVDSEVDSGKILVQAAVPIFDEDDKFKLNQRIQQQEYKILPIGLAMAGLLWRRN